MANEQQITRPPDYVVLPSDPHPPVSSSFCKDCGARLVLLRPYAFDPVDGAPLYAWRCPNYRWWRHVLLSRCWMSYVVTETGWHVSVEGLW